MLICAGAMEALARDLNLLPVVGMLNVSNIAMDHWSENDPVTHKWMYVWYETDGEANPLGVEGAQRWLSHLEPCYVKNTVCF